MKYIENGFYPAWVPHRDRSLFDINELAKPTHQIVAAANSLMERMEINIAVYKPHYFNEKNHLKGLCSIFEAAKLGETELNLICKVEEELENNIVVAYSKPLQYIKWEKV